MAPTPGHMGQTMQMHPGVSGAPHVSQPGAMMGMQPGAQGMGPGGMGGQHPNGMMQAQMGGHSVAGGMPGQQNMSHMTPQQAMQQQVMMQQMQNNPQLLQQQQMLRMRHHQQQQMLQQQAAAQQNGMNSMQQGMQLTPQQMAQMQHAQAQQQQQQQQQQAGGQSVQLPAHLMQQQMALHQQRMQAQAQQQQQTQLQQQMAMQHVNSQQSNQGQPTPQNPQAQPNNPQQIRPQSRMANPNEQAQASQQQHQAQGQAQPVSAPNQQAAQQGQQANAQNTPQALQRQQQIAMMQRQQMLAQQRQQAAMHNQSTTQQATNAQGGMFILRLMSFSDHIGQFTEESGKQMAAWNSLVDKHFAPEGRLIHSFDNDPAGQRNKNYEVLRPSVARYFWTYFDSGASSLRLHTENAREVPNPSGSHQVVCQNAIFSVSYPSGARLEMTGSLQVLFSAGSDAIECLQFSTANTDEIISRSRIEKVVSEWSPSLPNKSPKMAKNKLPKAQQKMQEQQDRLTMDHFPKAPKGTLGVSSKVQYFLEMGETMNLMSDLMSCAQEKKIRPEQALEHLAAQNEANGQTQQGGNTQIHLPMNGVPQGARTPSMGNMQMPQNGQGGAYASPSVANLNLPNGMNGSPHLGNHPGNLAPNMGLANSHTPSPHQSNMAAPPMVPQHSQQGTNSSVASANTSPNMNNTGAKRRRSTVKLEGDDGGGPDNSNRVKPSPRMAKKARP